MFDPLDTVQLGPLQVTMTMITYVISAAAFYVILSLLLKKDMGSERENILNQVSTAIIIFLIVYKLWPFALSPPLLLDLRNIIYYAGGPGAIVAASIISMVFFIIQWFRKKWSIELVDRLSIAMFTSFITHSLLLKEIGQSSPFPFGWKINGDYFHPVNVYQILLLLVFLIFSLQWTQGKGKTTILLVIAFIFTKSLLVPFQIK